MSQYLKQNSAEVSHTEKDTDNAHCQFIIKHVLYDRQIVKIILKTSLVVCCVVIKESPNIIRKTDNNFSTT